jgi:hypothetical protein
MNMTAIVTKQSLNELLADEDKRVHVIGRALVALFNRQTQAEQAANVTDNLNGIGFAGSDARSGSLTAKSYIKNRTLQQWQIDKWMTISRGYPRICKYAKQLNEIALEKRRKEQGGRLAALRQEYGMNVDSDDVKILEPIVKEMRALEQALGVEPYVIHGAVA